MRARLQTLVDKLLDASEGDPEIRRAAVARAVALTEGAPAEDKSLPAALAAWIERVARSAWKITDEDLAAVRDAGFDEEAIFETTIAAAVGAGIARYQIAERAMKAAAKSG